VSAIDNPYFPLPVGRRLGYRGIEDGQKEVDRVSVTDRTKVIEGITATVVRDEVLKQGGRLLEKTFDWYAQDASCRDWQPKVSPARMRSLACRKSFSRPP
jgi:hypothetical protein